MSVKNAGWPNAYGVSISRLVYEERAKGRLDFALGTR